MSARRTTSVEELQIISRFESLRKILLSDDYADCLDKPLAYWALPTDRRLPLAFLGRTLGDLLNTPFADLAATPGIGQKKIRSFVKLLARVSNTDPAELPMEITAVRRNGWQATPSDPMPNGFDPHAVSEVVWGQWRATVIRHGLGSETLGRFAPSLRRMTRVIWNTPLADYTDLTLAEIRAMKTHGEKRVLAILEVFYCVHKLVEGMGVQDHLVVRLVPRRVDAVEQWVGRRLQTPGVPDPAEMRAKFIHPLLEQIRTDTAQQIVRLAENRLGIVGPITSVRKAARQMGLTRARVYQLLNEINDVMNVRWPTGRHQVHELRRKFHAEAVNLEAPPDLEQFMAAAELFYPASRRGADGPLEQAALPMEDSDDGGQDGDGDGRADARLMEVAG
jgi:hypothetical protein